MSSSPIPSGLDKKAEVAPLMASLENLGRSIFLCSAPLNTIRQRPPGGSGKLHVPTNFFFFFSSGNIHHVGGTKETLASD